MPEVGRTYGDNVVAVLTASGYFVAGWMTCAVMSGSLLLWAVKTYERERQDERDDLD